MRLPQNPATARFLAGAHLRRVIVYAIAGVLIVAVALGAVRLATPPDSYHVPTRSLPGAGPGAETTGVQWDRETGETTIEVRETDGTMRRYRVNATEDGLRIREAPSAEE